EAVVAEFAVTLKSYRISKVVGDKYGGEWPREQFRKHGVSFEQSAKPKSDLYSALLPAINSGKIGLLDSRAPSRSCVPWNGGHRGAAGIPSITRRMGTTMFATRWRECSRSPSAGATTNRSNG